MKNLIPILILGLHFNVFARGGLTLNNPGNYRKILSCSLDNGHQPCRYFDLQSGLQYCVKEADIVTNNLIRQGHKPQYKIVIKRFFPDPKAPNNSKLKTLPDLTFPVYYKYSDGINKFTGNDSERESWVQLTFNAKRDSYVGQLTVEEDFAFDLDCKIVGF